jgi:hypothetical protein
LEELKTKEGNDCFLVRNLEDLKFYSMNVFKLNPKDNMKKLTAEAVSLILEFDDEYFVKYCEYFTIKRSFFLISEFRGYSSIKSRIDSLKNSDFYFSEIVLYYNRFYFMFILFTFFKGMH